MPSTTPAWPKLLRRVGTAATRPVLALAVCLAAPACEHPPEVSAQACASYHDALCAQAPPESAECRTLEDATELLPPAACAAAARDLEPTRARMAAADKCRAELTQAVCAAVGEASEACRSVTRGYRSLDAQACRAMTADVAHVVAMVREHAQELQQRPLTATP